MKLYIIIVLLVSLVHGYPESPRYDVYKSTDAQPLFQYYTVVNKGRTKENGRKGKSYGGANIRNGDINVSEGAYTEVSPPSNQIFFHYMPVTQTENNSPVQTGFIAPVLQTMNTSPIISALFTTEAKYKSPMDYKVSALQTVYKTPSSQTVYTVPVAQSNSGSKHQIVYINPVSQTKPSSQIKYRILAPQEVYDTADPQTVYSFATLSNDLHSKSLQRNVPEFKNAYTVVFSSKYNGHNQKIDLKPVHGPQDYQTVYSSVAAKQSKNKGNVLRGLEDIKTVYSASTSHSKAPQLKHKSGTQIIYGTPVQSTTNNVQTSKTVYVPLSGYKSAVPKVTFNVYNTPSSKTTYASSMPYEAPKIPIPVSSIVYNTPSNIITPQNDYKSFIPKNINSISDSPAAQTIPTYHTDSMSHSEYKSPELLNSIPSSSAIYSSPTVSSPNTNIVYKFSNTQTLSKLFSPQVLDSTLAPQKLSSQEYSTQDAVQKSKRIYYVY